ncbi:lymphocyte antigen 75-like [Clupea harengus]|uniref:Lymphocyte antigen 75-like n=1 Tax=Clupea harengus TaxID=7950 RepID=A0A6P8GSJ7_CLUHA|nr:lymphocyte antigen 75-like [Clupea harengus]
MGWRLALLLVSGFVMECLSVPRHFIFVNKTKSWTEAQSYCRETYTDLATITNMEDMRMVRESGEGDNKHVWIGLYQTANPSWKWSLAEEGFYGPGEADFTDWKPNEPNNLDTEKCTVLTTEGQWNNVDCKTKRPFVCYKGPDRGSESYVLIDEKKSWREAQSYCRENYIDLVSVRNQEVNKRIEDKVRLLQSEAVWIGLFRDNWMWSDQTNSSFRKWGKNMPDNKTNDNCAVTKQNEDEGKWRGRKCDEEHPFICHWDKLLLVSEELSWRDALYYCRARHMDLVSVVSSEILDWVKKLAKDASTEHVWLGLYYLCPLDVWLWVKGETVCSTLWDEGSLPGRKEARGGAGAVMSREEQLWVSKPETDKLNFICATDEGE